MYTQIYGAVIYLAKHSQPCMFEFSKCSVSWVVTPWPGLKGKNWFHNWTSSNKNIVHCTILYSTLVLTAVPEVKVHSASVILPTYIHVRHWYTMNVLRIILYLQLNTLGHIEQAQESASVATWNRRVKTEPIHVHPPRPCYILHTNALLLS